MTNISTCMDLSDAKEYGKSPAFDYSRIANARINAKRMIYFRMHQIM